MSERKCKWCGDNIEHLRMDAVYCRKPKTCRTLYNRHEMSQAEYVLHKVQQPVTHIPEPLQGSQSELLQLLREQNELLKMQLEAEREARLATERLIQHVIAKLDRPVQFAGVMQPVEPPPKQRALSPPDDEMPKMVVTKAKANGEQVTQNFLNSLLALQND